ncbi:phosphatidate cytidylyltransferase, mitochondrial isoform X2 [Fukomys damarensis]|uniref:phosphatidate cytidylyltransferase, mitochondrial isoform X2 n=1 Tax=Fukomys damarensis TaxID=885580 RepID=UPI00053F2C6C|nr:phosphatidate cytidylyltransferase, mitochondrial isoform X2 [Fukomys damarensis]
MALQSSGVAFRRILSHFPEELSLAFAYGSGVYRQAGPSSDQKNAMLDFVFTVDDPVAWHSKNLKRNWSHYSFLKLLGPKMISSVQNNYGAGVYYNPLILCDGRLVKYGVISTSTLIEDLLGWNNLYIAGRLQKPVKIIAMNEDATLRSALDKNLRSAVTAAFLMLPESFSEEELFVEIAGLSYAEPFRLSTPRRMCSSGVDAVTRTPLGSVSSLLHEEHEDVLLLVKPSCLLMVPLKPVFTSMAPKCQFSNPASPSTGGKSFPFWLIRLSVIYLNVNFLSLSTHCVVKETRAQWGGAGGQSPGPCTLTATRGASPLR